MTTRHVMLEVMRDEIPIDLVDYTIVPARTGLVIVDEVNGFCTVGAGNLAPTAPDEQITRMIGETNRIARAFSRHRWPILAFLDTHEPGKPEHPYPPHCERGTGEENLVAELAWLAEEPDVVLVRKDCINGFVGAIEPSHTGRHGTSHNRVVDWVNGHRLTTVLTTGICTDICVMDFVLTMLSARNHGLMPTLKDIVVYEPGCATYDLPVEITETLSLPRTAAHPKHHTHHMGLYFMASRGAVLAGELIGL
ncbi:MAG: isochorismatase family protein [Geminicoccaceae bacterium]